MTNLKLLANATEFVDITQKMTTILSGQTIALPGADPSGTANTSPAFSAAAAALNAYQGGVVRVQGAIFKTTSSVNFPSKGLHIRGDGPGSTRLDHYGSINLFSFPAAVSCKVSGMTIIGHNNPTAGALVTFDPGPGVIAYGHRVEDVNLSGYYIGLYFARGSGWKVEGLTCYGSAGALAAILIEDLTNPDFGDNEIVGGYFGGDPGSGAAFLQKSSGGLKITNTKINGLDYGYRLILAGATSDLNIIGGSFENCAIAAMSFEVSAGNNDVFFYVNITGSQTAYTPIGIHVVDAGSTFAVFNIRDTIHGVKSNGRGLLLEGGDFIVVEGAVFNADGSNLVNVFPIEIGINCKNPQIGPCSYRGFSGPTVRLNRMVTGVTGASSFADLYVAFPPGLFTHAPVLSSLMITGGTNAQIIDHTLSETGCWIRVTAPGSGIAVSLTLTVDGYGRDLAKERQPSNSTMVTKVYSGSVTTQDYVNLVSRQTSYASAVLDVTATGHVSGDGEHVLGAKYAVLIENGVFSATIIPNTSYSVPGSGNVPSLAIVTSDGSNHKLQVNLSAVADYSSLTVSAKLTSPDFDIIAL